VDHGVATAGFGKHETLAQLSPGVRHHRDNVSPR
jgi:hypothetical protein